jgi:dipeptidyl aminopeptidase/acylaminoacyl peptidase
MHRVLVIVGLGGLLAGALLVGTAKGTDVSAIATSAEAGATGPESEPISVRDAIEMVRIQDAFGQDRQFVAISPDGSRLAAVVWWGDLEQNVNVHALLTFDLEASATRVQGPEDALLSIPFPGDSLDQAATPIDQLAFLGDNRTLVFRATLDGGARQVHAVHLETGELRTLTRHPDDVEAYAVADDGSVRLYTATTPGPEEVAWADRLRRDGGSAYARGGNRRAEPFAAAANVLASMGLVLDLFRPEVRRFYTPADTPGGDPVVLFEPQGDRSGSPSRAELRRYLGEDEPVRGSLEWMLGPGVPDSRPPGGWTPVRWKAESGELVLERGDTIALARWDGGSFSAPRRVGVVRGLNRHRPIVTDGRGAVGVVDGPTDPPELGVLDLETGDLRVLTDLNPELRNREHGEVRQIRFGTPFDSLSTAWVVRPVPFSPHERYPLVVLHSNTAESADDRSYLIDGRMNLSGHAAQPLAAAGFVVLFLGTPPGRAGRANETEAMRAHTESAIRTLAREGYVDTLRVGVSGWSRSAYYTENLLMHSDFPFAAATLIDGGAMDYAERSRPYTDDELRRIRTPLLAQAHGLHMLAHQGAMTDRLRALGIPTDLLAFPSAPHSTRAPRHRLTSLTTHVDWWRYWLQGYEDPDPTKAAQYRRWRGF